jgi:hypothetical protein
MLASGECSIVLGNTVLALLYVLTLLVALGYYGGLRVNGIEAFFRESYIINIDN